MITYSSRASFFAAAKIVKGFNDLSTASSTNSTAQKCIQDIFGSLQGTRFSMVRAQRIKIELVKELVSDECLKAEERRNKFKDVFKLMNSVPITGNLDERVYWLNSRLNELPVMPVITPFSTRVFSNELPYILYDTTQLALLLNQPKLSENIYKELKVTLSGNMHLLVHNTLLSKQDLTPSEVVDREYGLHQKTLETFSEFYNNIIDDFITVHGGEKVVIRDVLKPAMMRLGAYDTNSFLQRLQQERAHAYLSRSDITNKSSEEILKQLIQSIGGELDTCIPETCDLLSPVQRLQECIDAYQKRPHAQTEENIVLACLGIQQAEEYKALTGQISFVPKYAFR